MVLSSLQNDIQVTFRRLSTRQEFTESEMFTQISSQDSQLYAYDNTLISLDI